MFYLQPGFDDKNKLRPLEVKQIVNCGIFGNLNCFASK